ncbi:hypothetical protein SBADM41S_06411 [Streptomyces badius]
MPFQLHFSESDLLRCRFALEASRVPRHRVCATQVQQGLRTDASRTVSCRHSL